MSLLSHIKDFPRFAYHIVSGVITAILTEPETFLLTVAAVLVGLAVGAAWAVAAFLTVFVFLRFAGQFVGGLARELHFIGAVLRDREFEITLKEDPPSFEPPQSIFPPRPPTPSPDGPLAESVDPLSQGV